MPESFRAPSPDRNEAEETEGVAGFRAEVGEGEEGRLLRGRCRGFLLLLVVRFVLLDAREETQAGLEGEPRG